ncbi:MAG: L,D-transpeptidase family protein [Thermodesulforhabdaceae bacterium]
MKRILLTTVMFCLGVVLITTEAKSDWCFNLRDFSRPDLITARAIVSFYRQPWSEWLQSFIAKRFEGAEASDLRSIYKATSGNLLFIDSQFKPKDSMSAIMRKFSGSVPREEEINRLIRELEEARQGLSNQFPAGIDPDTIKLCPSQEPEKNFFISGEAIEKERENNVIQWAKHQKKAYERLAEKGLELDSIFTASVIGLLKSKTPYPGLSWISFVDNETAMVDFLNFDVLYRIPTYKALKEALPKYEDLARSSQISVNIPEKLKPGYHGPAITNVQKRLAQEGFFKGAPTGVLDEETKTALINFQRTHFVTPDGTVGQKTVEKMNIPYEEKLNWIRITLEGMEEAPFRLYSHFIWVNIPTFSLEYYYDGNLISRHKVIVGRTDGKQIKVRGKIVRWNNTLPLVSEIKSVVINPRWYVPERIRIELEREAANDEFYFQKRGFRMLDSTYSWGEPRLYQLPGGRNPLGKVKFLFDNPYGFFLHDTPEQHLFKRAFRAISHGCVRVERALDLAREILERDNPKKADQIDSYLKKPDQTFITLERPVPIVITYFPVLVSEDGLLEFGGDIYGWKEQNGFKVFF